MIQARGVLVLGLGVVIGWGCGGEDTTVPAEATATLLEPIIGGALTTSYPEATLLNMRAASGATYACSAVLIAPRVVLTAGHCVDGMVSWDAYISGAHATSTRGETYDWHENGATTVNPNHHDLGLVYLDQTVALAAYPTLASTPAASGAQVIDVGRIDNGVLTNAFYRAPVTVTPAASAGYPFDYSASDVIEHGDSGGPVFLPSTHTIVAVNSGANTTIEVLARVDLLAAWIAARVAANSGSDAGHAPDAAGAADSSADAAPLPDAKAPADATAAPDAKAPPADAAPPSVEGGASDAAACVREVEPNDTLTQANPLGAAECAILGTASDVDWFAFTPKAGVSQIALTSTGDASIGLGFFTSPTACSLVIPSSARAVGATVTVTGSGQSPPRLCVVVGSPSHAVQSYTLTVR
ncbi:MAG TPA: trypsin-like serine protease [Polyangiaceae bacterium]|nr:trypsin-like serine protease [Polyangiaceae bacterium]